MPWHLRWKGLTQLTVWGDTLRPDRLAGLSRTELERIQLRVGSGQELIPALFSISGEPDGETLHLEGSLENVREVGRGMKHGRLEVAGNLGSYAGAEMQGGVMTVAGSAGPGAGVAMAGGVLQIGGMAGDYVGGPWPGETVGMRGGIIVVDGGAGEAAAHRMRRGLLLIHGPTGAGLGWGMIAGTVILTGDWPDAVGIGMRRGSIITTNPTSQHNLTAGFMPAGRQWPGFLALYLRALQAHSIPCTDLASHVGSAFDRYNGDRLVSGQGEILIRAES
jgi:formylmethanofuran dehydrogenase subunit C